MPVHATTVSPERFRHAIGHFATGVTVVTAADGDRQFGTTASAVSSLSLAPPMLLVCLSKQSVTGAAIGELRTFAVSVLAQGQDELARRFAGKGDDKFAGVDVVRGESGAPLLAEALAQFECHVVEEVTGGTHTVFLAAVDAARTREGAAPLTYFRGGFGFFVSPFTFAAIEDAFRGRLAIQLGAADLTVGRLDRAQLAELRLLMERTLESLPLDLWLESNRAFHERAIELAGSPVLLDGYRRLAVPELMTAVELSEEQGGPEWAIDHVALMDAYERGDLPAAHAALVSDTQRAIDRYRGAS